MTRIVPPTTEHVAAAAAILRAGGLVGMPTETVYGLAGAAFDERALAAIYEAKERPRFDPLIVHVLSPAANPALPPAAGEAWLAHLEQLHLLRPAALAPLARGTAARLAERFWPGPLTLVLPKHPRVPDLATSGLPTVAVRAPRHPVAQNLLRAAGTPLAAPSANRFGRISPTTAEHVRAELEGRVELILDGGPCAVGLESTVVLVDEAGTLRLLRPGGVSAEDLARAAEAPVIVEGDGEEHAPSPSPGRTGRHYAPDRPLYLLASGGAAESADELRAWLRGKRRLGLLLLAEPSRGAALAAVRAAGGPAPAMCEALSPLGELPSAAAGLFAALRRFDAAELDGILAEAPASSAGLGAAIRDRLTRASRPASADAEGPPAA